MARHRDRNTDTGHNSGQAEGGEPNAKILSKAEADRARRVDRDSFAVAAHNRPKAQRNNLPGKQP